MINPKDLGLFLMYSCIIADISMLITELTFFTRSVVLIGGYVIGFNMIPFIIGLFLWITGSMIESSRGEIE